MNPTLRLTELTERLVKGLKAEQAWIFGSYARGDANADSDMDILIVINESKYPRYKRNQAARRLVKDITIPKDIIVMTKDEWELGALVPSSLVCTVKNEGRLLYG